jgi:hypothetical protein
VGRPRFPLGDAGHLSSPFGGEGLNSGLHDAHDLAWKLALVLRGRGRAALLESFESERHAADRNVLVASDRVHELAHGAVESARTGVRRSPPTPDQVAALVRSRSIIDVSYAGSPLVGEHLEPGVKAPPTPAPGDRYPDRAELEGTRHHVLLFGTADDAGAERLRRRRRGLVDASGRPATHGARASPRPARSWCGRTGISAFGRRRPTQPGSTPSTRISTRTSSPPEPVLRAFRTQTRPWTSGLRR